MFVLLALYRFHYMDYITKSLWSERKFQDEMTFYKSRVVKISNIMERGIYAPMTATGDIVVNGVLASCHNVVRSHILQDTFFGVSHLIIFFNEAANECHELFTRS